MFEIGVPSGCLGETSIFCRAMLCKRGLCRHAVSVCLSVCHVRELCQNVSSIFLPSISHAILVFHAKQHSNIPTEPS